MTPNKVKNIINAIQDHLEDKGYLLSEWEHGFLEDIQKKLQNSKELTSKQFDKLTDIIGFNYLNK